MSEGPTFFPCVAYRDARAAIDWLERAFGFERMMIHPEDGPVVHAELAFGTGVLMVTTLDEAFASAPKRRYNAPYVYVADPDAHHARAVAAGAEITRPLENTDYGSREYCARDLEGNEWSFGTYRPVPAAARELPNSQPPTPKGNTRANGPTMGVKSLWALGVGSSLSARRG